jgi:hypothetical protein
MPRRLEQGDADSLIGQVASRLYGYCPPLMEPSRAGEDGFKPNLVRTLARSFDEQLDRFLTMCESIVISSGAGP